MLEAVLQLFGLAFWMRSRWRRRGWCVDETGVVVQVTWTSGFCGIGAQRGGEICGGALFCDAMQRVEGVVRDVQRIECIG